MEYSDGKRSIIRVHFAKYEIQVWNDSLSFASRALYYTLATVIQSKVIKFAICGNSNSL
jgi:hypothetical protein